MPELPDRPDMDQLRRQARDLHRAATAGVPDAVGRIRKVSDRMALSTAQLAVAREYGCPSWPALRAEVERRRAMVPAISRQFPAAGVPSADVWADRRSSFGGGSFIRTADGVLSPDVLTVGFGHAMLHGSGVLYPQMRPKSVRWRSGRRQWARPGFDDLAATDDQGAAYTLAFGSGSLHFARPGEAPQRSGVSFWVDPVPPAETSWIEVRARGGSASRLVRSPRATVRVSDVAEVSASATAEHRLEGLAYWLLNLSSSDPGYDLNSERASALARAAEIQQSGELTASSELPRQLERLCGCLIDQQLSDDLPAGWRRFRDELTHADGLPRHLDLAAAVPELEDLSIQIDHLVSRPDSWTLYLRAKPTWWGYSEDGRRKWARVSVRADDDQGGSYASSFGGSSGDRHHEELQLEFTPRIDPLARRLTLTFGGKTSEAVVELDLASAAA